jgi:endonuclease G
MKKKLVLTILLSLITFVIYSQKVDTVLNNGVYKSYINYDLKQPIYVVYKLYNGGGPCSRAGFFFKNDTQIKMAGDKDYLKSGYDKGHLANAEDFAFDCKKDELTFRYYNCLPQTPNMNRGVWKQYETKIRELSKTDSLLVICGGRFKDIKKIGDNCAVPDHCFKIVKSLSTGKLIYVVYFDNVPKDAKANEITIDELLNRLGYQLPMTY